MFLITVKTLPLKTMNTPALFLVRPGSGMRSQLTDQASLFRILQSIPATLLGFFIELPGQGR